MVFVLVTANSWSEFYFFTEFYGVYTYCYSRWWLPIGDHFGKPLCACSVTLNVVRLCAIAQRRYLCSYYIIEILRWLLMTEAV